MSDVVATAHLTSLPSNLPLVRVLLVDDNAGFRDSLISLLDTEEMTVVGQARQRRPGPGTGGRSRHPT